MVSSPGCQAVGPTGTQTAALAYGGFPTVATTQGYDGSAWSTRPSLANARGYHAGCGTTAAALAIGGNWSGDYHTETEEFTGETSTTAPAKTLTTS